MFNLIHATVHTDDALEPIGARAFAGAVTTNFKSSTRINRKYTWKANSLGYLCNIRVEPTTNCNSNETYAILFQIYSCITY